MVQVVSAAVFGYSASAIHNKDHWTAVHLCDVQGAAYNTTAARVKPTPPTPSLSPNIPPPLHKRQTRASNPQPPAPAHLLAPPVPQCNIAVSLLSRSFLHPSPPAYSPPLTFFPVVLGTFSASFSRSMGGRRWRRSTMSSAGPISVSATRGTWGRERWDVGGARVGGGEKQAGVCGSGTRWLLAQPPHLHHAPIAPPSLRPPHTAVQLLMLFNFTAQPYRLLGHPQPANHPPPSPWCHSS